MKYEKDIDVRVLIPINRHTLLLQMFSELLVGESFTFINDHDPIPLYYEFRSIHGEVVGWEYLNRGGRDWKVKATRTAASQAREFIGVSTLIDLRKIDKTEWQKVVLHRYGMMPKGDTMELIAASEPTEILHIFNEKFNGKHTWSVKSSELNELIIHIKKEVSSGLEEAGFAVVNEFDVRPYSPTVRHEMFYQAFADIKPGEAFEFVNDHDPKPLYYQMKAESKDPFTWEYLQEGPDDWKVRVVKVKE